MWVLTSGGGFYSDSISGGKLFQMTELLTKNITNKTSNPIRNAFSRKV